jgi:diaminopimelate epimerase
MIEIPFMKLHGAENDFILTWSEHAPSERLAELARRICARTTGIGADGWMLVSRSNGGLATRLFNSDGSEPELSGNGTRCAAAFGIEQGAVAPPDISIVTAAGRKNLTLLERDGLRFLLEMNMGLPRTEELRTRLCVAGRDLDAALLNVGNPQCVLFIQELPDNWRLLAQECERDNRFPQRTNVSFVRVLDRHHLDVVFFERGAGETRSSGTGATGAGCAAILRGVADSPIEIRAPAGTLNLRWDENVYLTGPAEIIGEGRFFLDL